MIPILFEHDDRQANTFLTNGLGRLRDCISCQVEEEINGIYECTFEYPATGAHFSDIREGRMIYCSHDSSGEPQPFDIYSHSALMGGVVTFHARHVAYRLNHVVLEPYEAANAGAAIRGIGNHYINRTVTNTFSFDTTLDAVAPFVLDKPASVKTVLGGMEGCILDLYGGEVIWDKWSVSIVPKRGQKRYIVLRYGKNLTDISYEIDTSEVASVVVPFWMSSDGSQRVMIDDVYVRDPDATLEKAIVLDVSSRYDTYPEEEDMIADANKALMEAKLPATNLQVKFATLWETDEYEKFKGLQDIRLGDEVKCIHTDMGLDEWLRVQRIKYDVLMERYDEIDLVRTSDN